MENNVSTIELLAKKVLDKSTICKSILITYNELETNYLEISVIEIYTLGIWCLIGYVNPSNAEATFVQSTWTKSFFENLNPIMLVFIWKLSMSALRWVPICQGSSLSSGFLHLFVVFKVVTSSIRVKLKLHWCTIDM